MPPFLLPVFLQSAWPPGDKACLCWGWIQGVGLAAFQRELCGQRGRRSSGVGGVPAGAAWIASTADKGGFLRIHYRFILIGFLGVLFKSV